MCVIFNVPNKFTPEGRTERFTNALHVLKSPLDTVTGIHPLFPVWSTVYAIV